MHGHDVHGAALSLSGGFDAMAQSVATVLRIRTVWIVVALQALMFIVVTPAITFLPIYVHSANGPFHLKSNTTALVAGLIIVVGGISGMLLGGVLADKLSARFADRRLADRCHAPYATGDCLRGLAGAGASAR